MSFASASMTKRGEEIEFSIMNTDSVNRNRIPGDCHPNTNDMTSPLPVVSVSPFPHWNHPNANDTITPPPVVSMASFPQWNMNETSQYYGNEPDGSNSIIDSSQFKTDHNLQMGHNYSHEGGHSSVLCRSDSRFPYPPAYIGWPNQYTRHDNLTISDGVMNSAFDLNNFVKPNTGGKSVTGHGSASRPQRVNPGGMPMSGNIGQPPHINLGMSLFTQNQGVAEPLLAIGKNGERSIAIGSGSNKESKSSAVIPNVNMTANSERVFLPPSNTYHHQPGIRSSLNPGLGMNGAFSGFQNDSEIMSDSVHTGNESVSDSRTGLRLGLSYASFQRPSAGVPNHLRQVNRDSGQGDVQDIGFDFADVCQKNDPERCIALPSLPFVGSQAMPCDSGWSRVNGQLLPSSIGTVTDKFPSEVLPKTNDKFSSQPFTSPPLVGATRSISGQDLSSNHSQSQVVGSVQPSNSPFQTHSTSDLGIQTGRGNMTAQVPMPSNMSSLKRAPSQPPSSTVQNQRRKTQQPQHFIRPSIQSWARLAPSVQTTPRAISPMVNTAQSLTTQAAQFSFPPLLPASLTTSALSAPSTTHSILPLMHPAPFLPPNDMITSSLHPSPHTPPLPNSQLISQSSARQRLSHTPPLPNPQPVTKSSARRRFKAPIIPSPPGIASSYINYKDETPEPIGHKCYLCKRDLSYEPEGPISQPTVPPAVAVLPCRHAFHEYCLERITPDDQSNDPPCIPCALGEQ